MTGTEKALMAIIAEERATVEKIYTGEIPCNDLYKVRILAEFGAMVNTVERLKWARIREGLLECA